MKVKTKIKEKGIERHLHMHPYGSGKLTLEFELLLKI